VGRLFWKFFAFIWLAQLTVIVAAGALFWLTEHSREAAAPELAAGPVAAMHVRAAAEVLQYAGLRGFRDWSERSAGPAVFALDPAGKDALGRPAPAAALAAASALEGAEPDARQIATVEIAEGQRYLLFTLGPGMSVPAGGPPQLHYWPRNLPPPTALVATLAGSVLTAMLLARYVAKPIRSLRSAFQAAAAGDLDRRIAHVIGHRTDELSDLGRDFDRMTERLRSSMEGQRRLLHDVSHELRSPLARLQAAVGLLRQEPRQLAAMSQRIEDEIARIDHLVSELLTLSRLEAGEFGGSREEVDMHDLLQDIVQDARFEAQAHGREVIWDEEAFAVLHGAPVLLHRAIENVVRNALKHTAGNTTIRIESTLSPDQRQYRLRVLDRGPGVAPAELPKLFTPFFRAASEACAGFGLGLAIARRCVEAHGGTIHAENRPTGGLCVEIELPCLAVPSTGMGSGGGGRSL